MMSNLHYLYPGTNMRLGDLYDVSTTCAARVTPTVDQHQLDTYKKYLEQTEKTLQTLDEQRRNAAQPKTNRAQFIQELGKSSGLLR